MACRELNITDFFIFHENKNTDLCFAEQKINFRFSSEYQDTESGLVYYNYRYYSPELGRWLSRDPIGEIGGWNLYAMVGNNAIGKIDYNGLVECCGDKEYDPKTQCCNEGNIESKVTDGTGEECCQSEMDTITLYVEDGSVWYMVILEAMAGGPIKSGHTFLGYGGEDESGQPNTAVGFYPDPAPEYGYFFDIGALYIDDLIITNNDVVINEDEPENKHDYDHYKKYTACPKTIEKLKKLVKNAIGNLPTYNLLGINCTTFATGILNDLGYSDVPSGLYPHGIVDDLKERQ